MDCQKQFHEACKNGNLRAITNLLNNHNIDVHVDNEDGFRLACYNGHLNVVQYLLKNNFNIDVHAENEDGFRVACGNGHLNVVQYLLENNFNIDVHAENEYGFIWACCYGRLNVVKYLLTKMELTDKMIKILCINKCEYFDEIKNQIKKYKHDVKLYNNKLQSCKFLFTLYKTMNVENTIYFGII